ncbi:unnamed protein product, partial [Urochloa humidicola]
RRPSPPPLPQTSTSSTADVDLLRRHRSAAQPLSCSPPTATRLAAACGVATGWLLVLRHRCRDVVTTKAFDGTRCLRELGAPGSPADLKEE